MEKIEEIISLIDSQEKKETKKVFIKYLRYWKWFAFFCSIGVVAGFFVYRESPEVFEIKSRILIKSEEKSMSSVLSFNNPNAAMRNQTNMENQLGTLRSYTLYKKALTNLNWETTWYHQDLLFRKELYKNPPFQLIVPSNAINTKNVMLEISALDEAKYTIKANGQTYRNGYFQKIEINQEQKFGAPFSNDFFHFTLEKRNEKIGERYLLNFNNVNTLTNAYLKATQVALENLNSQLISIALKSPSVQKEADFINELNNVFIEFGVESKYMNSENSAQFIDSQLSRLKKSLNTSEQRYSNYRRNNQTINLGQEAQLIYEKLEEIEQEQYLLQLQINYYSELQQYLDNSKKIEEMVNPSVIGITDTNLSSMLSKLMDLYSRREVLSLSVQDKAPSLIVVDKEIKITRDGLAETLKNQLKVSKSRMTTMDKRYNTVGERLKKLPDTEKKLIGVQREFELNNELYTYMLQKKAEASISKASISPEVQVIDAAIVEAAVQKGPSLVKNVGAGFIGGFMIPFVFITLLSFFNNKIETKEEIEQHAKIPVLEGIIRHRYKTRLPVLYHPRSGIAESIRGIKASLNAILEKSGTKIVSVNSLVPGEGKSFISSNFSVILSKTNKKVLLIGADMHKPTLHKFLDIEESVGLSNFLRGENEIAEVIFPTSIPNLHFIQAGPIPENPSDLIDSTRFENLFKSLKRKYDYIIIDNAPLLLVPDAILTSRFSNVSLFILRIGKSHKDEIRQINKIVDFNRISHAAIVVNGTPDHGYGYGKKYWKKGYGEYRNKMSIA